MNNLFVKFRKMAIKIKKVVVIITLKELRVPTVETDELAQLVEHRTAVREVASSNPGRTNTQGL